MSSTWAVNAAISRAQDNWIVATSVAVAIGVFLTVRYFSSPLRRLPPGPRGLPILGSALKLRKSPWLQFTEWKGKYGDVFYVKALGIPIVILNSQKAAGDLLEHRASIYSDRPRNIVAAEIMCGGLLLAFQNHTPLWRRMRKAAHEGLNNSDVGQHIKHAELHEALLLANGLLEEPHAWDEHMRRATASLIMSATYGTPPIASKHDPSVEAVDEFIERLGRATLPGAYFVEFFPWMKAIPSRFAKWKREAEEWFVKDSALYEDLLNSASATGRTTFSSMLLQDSTRYQLSSRENAWLAGFMYAAGADTTSATLAWWLLAMVAYPEMQKRAQAELDAVVGRTRIPTPADIPRLPYVRAILREVLRWRPVGPAGVPHCSSEDDWYEGMFIPAHTFILANVWAMNRDPEVYGADAAEFRPERHLDGNGVLAPAPPETKEEGHVTYGFGRRVCVGKQMANSSLAIDIAVMLWAFTFEAEKDASGKPISVDVEGCIEHGTVVRPIPFECNITPRFPDVPHMLAEERELRSH